MLLARRLPAPLARTLLRVSFRPARLWWRIRRPDQHGAVVAIHHGGAVLLLRQSYQPLWTMPGGGIEADEQASSAAVRELDEELGLVVSAADLVRGPVIAHDYLGRRDRVQFFRLDPAERPAIRIDELEIVEARWLSPSEARRLPLVPHVRDYLHALVHEAT